MGRKRVAMYSYSYYELLLHHLAFDSFILLSLISRQYGIYYTSIIFGLPVAQYHTYFLAAIVHNRVESEASCTNLFGVLASFYINLVLVKGDVTGNGFCLFRGTGIIPSDILDFLTVDVSVIIGSSSLPWAHSAGLRIGEQVRFDCRRREIMVVFNDNSVIRLCENCSVQRNLHLWGWW